MSAGILLWADVCYDQSINPIGMLQRQMHCQLSTHGVPQHMGLWDALIRHRIQDVTRHIRVGEGLVMRTATVVSEVDGYGAEVLRVDVSRQRNPISRSSKEPVKDEKGRSLSVCLPE